MNKLVSLFVLAVLIFVPSEGYCGISSIQELNQPERVVGVSESGAAFLAVKQDLPKAKRVYVDGHDGYVMVQNGKIDAYAFSRKQMELAIANGLKGVRLLPGNIGEPTRIAIGISRASKIPNLKSSINQFVSELKVNGTLQDMYKRWVTDEKPSMPDLKTSGTLKLKIGTIGLVPPFSYYEGNRLIGYDIELGLRLAEWLGAEAEFRIYSYGGLIAAAATGEIDCIMADMNITPERAEKIDFSDVLFTEENALMVKGEPEPPARRSGYSSISELAGKRIGVQTGTNNPEVVAKFIPTAELVYLDTMADILTALKIGKIDAFGTGLAIARFMAIENDDIMILDSLTSLEAAPIFPKTKEGEKLCAQFSEFIKAQWDNGTIQKLDSIWFGRDEDKRTAKDYESLPAPNGKLKMAVDLSLVPFAYIKNNKIVGYDVDLCVKFCEAYGYGLEIIPMSFGAIIPALQSGKCDFAACSIAYTPERAENVLFAYPDTKTGNAIVVRKPETKAASSGKLKSFDDLAGKSIAVITGTNLPELTLKYVPTAKLAYFDTVADTYAALRAGKVDALCAAIPTARLILATDDSLMFFGEQLSHTEAAPVFAKTEAGKKLCDEFSEFFKTMRENGTLDELESIWFGADESRKVIKDYTKLPATNGTLRMATDVSVVPYVYMKDNKITGYDADCIVRFCEANGYGLEIVPVSFAGMIPAVVSGKCDFAMDGIVMTDERKESVLFSYPNLRAGNAFVVRTSDVQLPESENLSSFEDLAGRSIAVCTGTTLPQITLNFVPTARLVYFEAIPDMFTALKARKVDAVCAPTQMAKLVMAEDDSLAFFGEPLTNTECAPIFAKTEAGKRLCDEFSEFFRSLRENGTLDELSAIWFGDDESLKVTKDYTKLPAPNGTLKMASEVLLPPVIYVKGNVVTGYDVDCVVRFCEAKGYGLEIMPMGFTGVIPAVMSGRCDFGMGGISITDERKESVLFSYPNLEEENSFIVRKSDIQLSASARLKGIQDLAGKRIGVQSGTRSPEIIKERIPNATLIYHDAVADNVLALRTGKVDAVCLPEPVARFFMHDNADITVLGGKLTNAKYAPTFPKTEKGRKLCEEYSEFMKTLRDDGTMDEIASVWLGHDDSKKVLKDYSKLPATNGTLKMAADPSLIPFMYVKNNRIIGYDIDIAVRFCEAKGYALKVVPMNFPAIIPALSTGKCDLSVSMSYTPERAESVLFASTPSIELGSILLVRKSDVQVQASGQYTRLQDLSGKKVGIILGANHDVFAAEKIPNVQIEYFNDIGAITLALQTGKIDAFANTLPTAIYMTHEHKDMSYIPEPLENTYTYSAFTDSEKGHKVCEEYSEFVKSLWDDGTIKRLSDKWIYSENEQNRTLEDYSKLPADNGTLRMAIDTGRMPFAYVKDNRIIGYDIEIAAMFCKSKGYGLEVYSMDFGGILGSIKTGKCDMTGSITKTEERAETMLFSPVPNAETPIVLIVMKTKPRDETVKPAEIESNAFIEELKASFERTFIREDRWQLFIEGIINTMIITVLSILCGTVLGFAVYLACRKGNPIANLTTRFFVWLIQGMPMVVLLMILYYIIFGQVDIAGIWVAVIAFSLTFGAGFYGMLRSGVNAIDKGQTEAAYALGFTDRRAFFTIILPQAALHFMPAYKGEVVALIKATAIVGYIAVQDLTKMGDIVRSRTYEAFFPLIAVAVIYFVLAGALNVVVGYVSNRLNPRMKRREDILRGIKTHD